MMQKLPARIAFTEFTPTDAKTSLGGSISNQTDAARSFAVKIEFLDKTGNGGGDAGRQRRSGATEGERHVHRDGHGRRHRRLQIRADHLQIASSTQRQSAKSQLLRRPPRELGGRLCKLPYLA